MRIGDGYTHADGLPAFGADVPTPVITIAMYCATLRTKGGIEA